MSAGFLRLCTTICKYAMLSSMLRHHCHLKAYYSSPSVKFWFATILYAAFVGFQTYVFLRVIDNPVGGVYSNIPTRVVYVVWLLLYVLDELIQIKMTPFHDWVNNIFNRVDMFMYLSVITGIILCHIPTEAGSGADDANVRITYDTGRIFLSLGSICFFLRFLHSFTIDSTLGPTIMMIRMMLYDFKVFLLMLVIVAVAFGVGYTIALTDPEQWKDHQSQLAGGIFYYTYFQVGVILRSERLPDHKLGLNKTRGAVLHPSPHSTSDPAVPVWRRPGPDPTLILSALRWGRRRQTVL
eukprot:sb/3467498/